MTNPIKCVSCGMPIRSIEEHGGGNIENDFCNHCSTSEGKQKSYEEVHAGMSAFLKKSQGIEESIASNMAKEMMAKLPAWKNPA